MNLEFRLLSIANMIWKVFHRGSIEDFYISVCVTNMRLQVNDTTSYNEGNDIIPALPAEQLFIIYETYKKAEQLFGFKLML